MWYFTWILGVSFAASFAILNAMWFEAHAQRTIETDSVQNVDQRG